MHLRKTHKHRGSFSPHKILRYSGGLEHDVTVLSASTGSVHAAFTQRNKSGHKLWWCVGKKKGRVGDVPIPAIIDSVSLPYRPMPSWTFSKFVSCVARFLSCSLAVSYRCGKIQTPETDLPVSNTILVPLSIYHPMACQQRESANRRRPTVPDVFVCLRPGLLPAVALKTHHKQFPPPTTIHNQNKSCYDSK